MRAALKMFTDAMNEEEKESLEIMGQRLEQIYNEIFRQKGNKVKSGSLQTYYRRVKRVLNDNKHYGNDPVKYASWTPQRRSHAPKPAGAKAGKKTHAGSQAASHVNTPAPAAAAAVGANDRFEITFDNGQRALLILPARRSASDVQKLKKLIDFLDATTDKKKDTTDEQKGPSQV
jgi:hypothetical protein